MAAAAAVVIVGAAISAYGQHQADEAQAAAEQANADYYQKEAQHAKQQADRQASLWIQEADQSIGSQVSSLSKAGVDMSGSALLDVSESRQKKYDQLGAIELEGNMNVELASKRAQMASSNAQSIYNSEGLRTAGTLLGGFGSAASMQAKSNSARAS